MRDFRFLSINQLAKVTGKDRQTIARRLSEVEASKSDKRGDYYDTWNVLPLIYAGDNKSGYTQKIQQAELEIQREKLQKIRNENEKTAGLLVSIEDVVKAVEREYNFVKSQLLTLPSKLAKVLSMENDPAVVFDKMHSGINELLTELTTDTKLIEDYERLKESGEIVIKEKSDKVDSD